MGNLQFSRFLSGGLALLASLILFLSITTPAFAQDTATQLNAVVERLGENREALAYNQDLLKRLDDVIVVRLEGKSYSGEEPEYIGVPKAQFKGWASGEILTGRLSPGEVAGMVNVSTAYKKVAKKRATDDIKRAEAEIADLEAQQKKLTQALGQESSPGHELIGTWIGTSGKGGFREEWTIKGIDGRFDVGIAYYQGNRKVGWAYGNGSMTDGKLRFHATVPQPPDPSWATSVDFVASASGDTLTAQWSNQGGSGTVSFTRNAN